MKTPFVPLLLATLLALSFTPLHADYSPPTRGQLDQLLANPNLVAATLKGADAIQAAELLIRVIDRLNEAKLNDAQRTYMIAYYSSRFTFLLPNSELNAFASAVIAQLPPEFLPAVLSGFSLGGRGSSEFLSHVEDLVQDNDAHVMALRNPGASMAKPVFDRLVITLAASQTLPPTVIDSLPPPIPVGEGDGIQPSEPSVPPPVAEPYDGQG